MQAHNMRSAPAGSRRPMAAQRAAGAPRSTATARRPTVLPSAPHRCRRHQAAAAAGEPPAPEPPPSQSGSGDASGSMDALPRAVSLPAGLPTAGAVFFMAGALKIVMMCFPWAEVSILAFVYGRSDLGVWGAIKAAPVALALAAAAKVIVDRGLLKRRWVQPAIVVGGALMLWISRLVFARPKPSPLDPMFHRLRQERIAALAEQRRAAGVAAAEHQQRQRQGHLLKQPDAEHGRALLAAQEQAAKQEQGRLR